MRIPSRPVLILLLALACSTIACPDRSSDSESAPPPSASPSTPDVPAAPAKTRATAPDASAATSAPARITPENLLENERYWPEIAALVEPFMPAGGEKPLKKGYRGALVRIDDQGRARIDFGRHGKHDVPIRFTDVVDRANRVASGELYKIAPNFVAHYGTLFLHPSTPEVVPYPTAELAKAERFLCVFANPRDPAFDDLVSHRLKPLADQAGLQPLFFPLAMKQNEYEVVKTILNRVGWPVPFDYGEAAEKHARVLLGEVPSAPQALLVTREGRLLVRGALDSDSTLDAIRRAVSGQ